jgi:hypothetical protein
MKMQQESMEEKVVESRFREFLFGGWFGVETSWGGLDFVSLGSSPFVRISASGFLTNGRWIRFSLPATS